EPMTPDEMKALIAWNRKRSLHYADRASEAWRSATSGQYAHSLEVLSAEHWATADALEAALSAHPAPQQRRTEMSKSSDVRLRIADAIQDHEHEGNGLCRCGSAIGWTDGVTVEVHEVEHQAAMAYLALSD